VAGDDDYLVGESEQTVVDGGQNLAGVATGEIGAADGAGEEGVSGEQKGMDWKVEADAAFGVTGGVDDGAGETGDSDEFALFEGVVRVFHGRRGDAEPGGLNIHHLYQGQVLLVIEDGGSGEALEAISSGDVVDVSVGDEDLFDGEGVFGEERHDAGDVVSGVDDESFVRGFVAEDGAVALEGTDGDGF
jgi:hypothetical protein